MKALYVTHPQVVIDPNVPTPRWGLNEKGLARARAFAARGVVPDGAMIFASDETKATDLAGAIAAAIGAEVIVDTAMGENDRSSTGFLAPEQFEATADRFFAQPDSNIDGWETARDAQERIVAAVRRALETVPAGTPAVFCGHGAVGTLLKCFVGGRVIARDEDQRRMADPGGGNAFVFDLAAMHLHSDWMPMEALAPGWFD
ncbi:histidine phosphatase family protein [Devosia ginsengisoli]|uniref:Histidine phosphatase family protein n=1 Tax=Devosia ginsengisoli TaxID=400770 RepID=A0A5B8LWZ8_9HYPH|nr:histidine phosphatase family protein [Devosia ginsengisoli]QDZ12204.1 histidine phosphatase family protein [Devosia ginsengisoli]